MRKSGRRPIATANFGNAVADYVNHRVGFPSSLFDRLADWRVGVAQQSILDLGTGTGSLARGFAMRGNKLVAIDIAIEMIKAARLLDEQEKLDVQYCQAEAEAIPVAANSMDAVSAGQCWHWFNASKVTRETLRVLKPGGYLVIAHYDWIPLQGNLVRATEKLIEKHNPRWRGGNWNGIYGQWLRDMGEAGFDELESFSFDEAASYLPDAWRGRVRASAGVQGSLSHRQVQAFDRDLQELLRDRFTTPLLSVPHRVFVAIGRKPFA